MITVNGYSIHSRIAESQTSLVYRAQRQADGLAVILKCLKATYPSNSELTRYKQEFEITQSLGCSGVIKAHDLIRHQNGLIMVLEDFGAVSLHEYLQRHPLSVEDFLGIVGQITEALGQIHQRGVIHKDINPFNIVIHPTRQEVKLIDFGISTRLWREDLSAPLLSMMEGTLSYMSPEQTGRMNRRLDYRSDFYSLGVTCYELLTRQRPFVTEDPLELVYCHLARMAIPPHERVPDVPPGLSAVVMKLLSKNAEDRYQSAAGLQADWIQCLERWRQQQRIPVFSLGQRDLRDYFEIPQKLYGREAEVQTLLQAFAAASQGSKQWVLVTGYSGIGKSSLVQEIHKPITEKRGFFVQGKCDQLQQPIPYAPLIQACQSLIQRVLGESDSQLQLWRQHLVERCGDRLGLLMEVVPELALLLESPSPTPEQEPFSDLDPVGRQHRLHDAFTGFLQVFAQPEHPLVIFLDDLQWADIPTLTLLSVWMKDAQLRYLLLVGAYRDNEVDPHHPLQLTLDALKPWAREGDSAHPLAETALFTLWTLSLQPLDRGSLGHLLSDALQQSPESLEPLTGLVLQKTSGNPFFIKQFLFTLYQEQGLWWDPGQRNWGWDLQQIQQATLTANVLDLVSRTLRQHLSVPVQRILSWAACLGSSFDVQTLAQVLQSQPEQVYAALQPAVLADVIVPLSPLEIRPDLTLWIRDYRFSHDRLQEAAYELLPPAERTAVHYHIGRILLAQDPEGEHLFQTVSHLNAGHTHLKTDADLWTVVDLNWKAGLKAKASAAFAVALDYFCAGLDLLTNDLRRDLGQHELVFQLHLERIQAEYLNNRFDQVDHWLAEGFALAATPLEQAQVLEVKLWFYNNRGAYPHVVDWGRQGLAALGLTLPDTEEAIDAAIETTLTQIATEITEGSVADWVNLPDMTDPVCRVMMRILSPMCTASYFARPRLLVLLFAHMVRLSIQNGNCEQSAYAYVYFGDSLRSYFEEYDLGYAFGQLGIAVSERYQNAALQGRVLQVYATFLSSWYESLRTSRAQAVRSFQLCQKGGEQVHAGFVCTVPGFIDWHLGEPLSLTHQELERAWGYLQQIQFEAEYPFVQLFQQGIRALQGSTLRPISLSDEAFDEDLYVAWMQERQLEASLHAYYTLKMQLCAWFGEIEIGLAAYDAAAPLSYRSLGHFRTADSQFQHGLLVAMAGEQATSSGDTTQILDPIVSQFQDWAQRCPVNFEAQWRLLQAEQARLQGRDWEAIRFYQQAIATAQQQGLTQYVGLGHERLARFWLEQHQESYAAMHFHEARYAYQRWGATAKIAQLEQQFAPVIQLSLNQLSRNHLSRNQASPITTLDTHRNISMELDLRSVVQAAQLLSRQITLDGLLNQLLQIAIENAGAERGSLLLYEGGEWHCAASGTADSTDISVDAPLLDRIPLPQSVIHYVTRTQKPLVLDHADQEGNFGIAQDPYIQTHRIQSVMVVPILRQGQWLGLIYLEHRLIAEAFNPERLEILQLLSAQAAISLENARLYQALEQRVEERTEALQANNEELQRQIAQRMAAEATAQAAAQTAEAATQTKSEFLANMSHEIRTPLNAVIGMAGLLLDTPLSAQQQDFAETIRQGGNALLALINDILDFSKVEAGRLELEEHPFTLRDCLEESLDLVATSASAKGLDLGYWQDADVPWRIRGDVTRLRQILVNLLSNAVKFTLSGEVLLSVKGRSSFELGSNWTDQPHLCELCFVVCDSGIGIPPDRMDRLFHSFSQVDSSTTRQFGGTGLGLAISQQLCALMGGTMWVESQGCVGGHPPEDWQSLWKIHSPADPSRGIPSGGILPGGATFYFTIQVNSIPDPARPLSTYAEALAGKHLLLVDTASGHRHLLQALAESWGMQVSTIDSIYSLLERLAHPTPWDVVLVNMQRFMQNVSTLALKLRRQQPSLPLVLMTSLQPTEVDPDLPHAAVITRPIKHAQLQNVLSTLILKKSPHRQASRPIAVVLDPRMAERHPLRILLAEDNAVNQKMALLLLQRMGYRADVVSNGQEVLESLRTVPYDVVLMDVQMPVMDGLTATRHLCASIPPDLRPWIIGVTANAMSGDREACLRAGMNDYLSKPIVVEELIRALKESTLKESTLKESNGRLANPSPPAASLGLSGSQNGSQSGSEIPPSAVDSDAVDFTVMDELRQMGDGILKEVVICYLEDSPELFRTLSGSMQSQDRDLLRRTAHSLKSSSRTVGALKLGDMCQEIERAVTRGETVTPQHLQSLQMEYQRVQRALETL